MQGNGAPVGLCSANLDQGGVYSGVEYYRSNHSCAARCLQTAPDREPRVFFGVFVTLLVGMAWGRASRPGLDYGSGRWVMVVFAQDTYGIGTGYANRIEWNGCARMWETEMKKRRLGCGVWNVWLWEVCISWRYLWK